jgi:hypothetical protein
VHREGHLRVVQDLAHARDGHGDGRGGRREGTNGPAARRGGSSEDVSGRRSVECDRWTRGAPRDPAAVGPALPRNALLRGTKWEITVG